MVVTGIDEACTTTCAPRRRIAMRGVDVRSEGLFSDVSCEARVPLDHPLRRLLPLVDAAPADQLGLAQAA